MFDSNPEPKPRTIRSGTRRGTYFLAACLMMLAVAAGYLILDLSGHRIDLAQINQGKIEFPQK